MTHAQPEGYLATPSAGSCPDVLVLRAWCGLPVTLHRYPGAGHWFFEPDRSDAYDKEAVGLAWERTLAFLDEAVR